MTKSTGIPTPGLWVPDHRVDDFIDKGYVVSVPQPEMTAEMKRFQKGSTHMKKAG